MIDLERVLAALGVALSEDEDFVTLKRGDNERIFSSFGATQTSLLQEAATMAREVE